LCCTMMLGQAKLIARRAFHHLQRAVGGERAEHRGVEPLVGGDVVDAGDVDAGVVRRILHDMPKSEKKDIT